MRKLALLFALVLFCGLAFGRAGGGCLLPGTMVKTPQGEKPIEQIFPGEEILSFSETGIVVSKVAQKFEVERDYYYLIKTSLGEISATAEHPFFVGNGAFKEAQLLSPNDTLYALEENKLVAGKILEISIINEKTVAYNLLAEAPNTFFANGFAVHNKGGGGGGGGGGSGGSGGSRSSPPDNLKYYDCKQAYEENGAKKPCCRFVSGEYVSSATVISAPKQIAKPDFPYCACSKAGVTVPNSTVFDSATTKCVCANDSAYASLNPPVCPVSLADVLFFSGTSIVPVGIFAFILLGRKKLRGKFFSVLRNATVLIAIGWVIFFPWAIAVLFFGLWGFLFFGGITGKLGSKFNNAEWSSTVSVSKNKIEAKAKKTSALLSFWDKTDPDWGEKNLKAIVESAFYNVQECWQNRDYSGANNVMMPGLLAEHSAQVESMKQRHETNKLEELKLLETKIVLAKNFHDKKRDEFTAWIKAQARDTILDDRTGAKIRGDFGIGFFEEFWAFQRHGSEWKLRKIDQPEEGMNIVGKENYDEWATKGTMQGIYQKTGSAATENLETGAMREQESFVPPVGGVALGEIKEKSGKIHNLLNFLAESNQIWNEQAMVDTARQTFILANTAIEQRKIDSVKNRLVPELLNQLIEQQNALIAKKQLLQKRNLAVRNVEIVLVRNYNNPAKDEFTAWISGQAQEVIVDEKTEKILAGDSFVRDFEEYWTFQRKKSEWLLKSIDKPMKAKDFVKQENLDEGTSKEMMQWFYSKERTV